MLCVILLGVLMVVVISISAILTRKAERDDTIEEGVPSITATLAPKDSLNRPTLELVKERGVVRCGATDSVPGFSHLNPETGVVEGMNVDQVSPCSIVAMPANHLIIVSLNRVFSSHVNDGIPSAVPFR